MRNAECGIDRFGVELGVTVRRSLGHSAFRIPNSALQERDRVAIDDHRAAGPRTQRPHDATDCAWLRGLHEDVPAPARSEEHTSELQSQSNLVCRLLLEKKNPNINVHSKGRPLGKAHAAYPGPAKLPSAVHP